MMFSVVIQHFVHHWEDATCNMPKSIGSHDKGKLKVEGDGWACWM